MYFDMYAVARTFAPTAGAALAIGAAITFAPVSLAQPADPAGPALRPCDWVPATEVSEILGKQVLPTPSDSQAGSNDPRCFYAVTADQTGLGISSELLLPGASAVDADTRLANAAAAPGATTVDGLGINAVCVYEPNVTPPSTTVVVLLDGGRVFRSIAAYEYCDTVERFARAAISRITA
jgi:hypothetical protein